MSGTVAGPTASVRRPHAFLLHGFLGSGKTSLARRLEAERRAVRFSPDEWMSRLYGADPPEAEFGPMAEGVSALMEDVWTRCLNLGVNVVLDFGFWRRAERERVRRRVEAAGAIPVGLRLSLDPSAAWRRIEARNRDLGRDLFICEETFRSLQHRFEPLAPEEAFIEAASDMDVLPLPELQR